MGLRGLLNTRGVFWGLQIHRQWPLSSAEHNQGGLGYKPTANGLSGSCRTHSGCFGVTNPPPMGLRVPPNTRRCFWVTNPPPWALRFRRKQSRCFGVTNTPPMGHQDPPNTTGLFLELQIPRQWALRFPKRNRAVSHKKCLITYRQ
ncbi:Hypothetical protein FKW44_000499 [Caligus rogercresseyi]|uniref:Uncharacterized protein n=1 Tax=Caligus rogercresseyi TaxID=217165 RepID=A0A7T8QUX5_CALRO|nr:Hypothetical protein FKW44_000499 [Caligus rogercresseyi]